MENLYSVRHLKRVQEKAKQKLAKIEKNIKKSKKDIRRRLEGKKNKDNFYKNKFVIKTDEVPKSSIKKSSTTKVSKTSRYKKKDKLFKLLNSAVDTRNQRSKERVRRNKSKGESNISNNDLLDSIIICGSKWLDRKIVVKDLFSRTGTYKTPKNLLTQTSPINHFNSESEFPSIKLGSISNSQADTQKPEISKNSLPFEEYKLSRSPKIKILNTFRRGKSSLEDIEDIISDSLSEEATEKYNFWETKGALTNRSIKTVGERYKSPFIILNSPRKNIDDCSSNRSGSRYVEKNIFWGNELKNKMFSYSMVRRRKETLEVDSSPTFSFRDRELGL